MGTGADSVRELPIQARILAVYPDEVIRQALKDRGLSQDVYDFIKHNWGQGAALTAALHAEPKP